MSLKTLTKSFKKFIHKKGATLIIGLGLSALLIVFSVGVGVVVRSTTSNIKAFKNQWQAQLVAESVKEKMLLDANEAGAGFSLENDDAEGGAQGCRARMIDTMTGFYDSAADPTRGQNSDDTPLDPSVGSGECSIAGKNDEPVYYKAGSISYTVPKANTGDAGVDCSPVRKFTSLGDLEFYGNASSAAEGQADMGIIANFFGDIQDDRVLNHPCNWGKLKFGGNANSRVVVPLYFMELENNVFVPRNPERNGLNDLRIRFRTPCKPIKERSECLIKDATGHLTDQVDTSKSRCLYEDVCEGGDRYELKTSDGDDTIVTWQVSGECTGETPNAGGIKNFTESCALMPDDGKDQFGKADSNSEIYESLFVDGIAEITQDKTGKIAYYSKDLKVGDRSLYNFITMQTPILVDLMDNSKYKSINKPILQFSIVVDSLKDIDTKNIPYLEYQIVTNVPVSNISQQFKTEINYQGQSFLQNYSIDQNKNVVDFALQD